MDLVYKLRIFTYIRGMEKTIDDKIKPFITDLREQPSPEYLAWTKKEIQKTKDWADKNPDKMISEHQIWEEFGLEY